MRTTKLRFLVVLSLQLLTDTIEQLHIALLRVLFERRDEGVGHGARRLAGDGGIGSIFPVSTYPLSRTICSREGYREKKQRNPCPEDEFQPSRLEHVFRAILWASRKQKLLYMQTQSVV